jgi:hypothetical protein
VRDEPHSYNDAQDVYYRIAYVTALLRAKTVSPWYEMVAASGKILKAAEYNFLPK